MSKRRVNRELRRLLHTWKNADMTINLIKQQYVISAGNEAKIVPNTVSLTAVPHIKKVSLKKRGKSDWHRK